MLPAFIRVVRIFRRHFQILEKKSEQSVKVLVSLGFVTLKLLVLDLCSI